MILAKYKIKKGNEEIIQFLLFDGEHFLIEDSKGDIKVIDIEPYIVEVLKPKENKIIFLEGVKSKEELIEKIKEVYINYLKEQTKKILNKLSKSNIKKIYEVKTLEYLHKGIKKVILPYIIFDLEPENYVVYYIIKTDRGDFLIKETNQDISLYKLKWNRNTNKHRYIERIEIKPRGLELYKLLEIIITIIYFKNLKFEEKSLKEIKKEMEKAMVVLREIFKDRDQIRT